MNQPDSAAPTSLSRATFVKGLLGAGAAAVVGPLLFPDKAAATSGQRVSPALSPMDLDWSVIDQFRPFDLISPGFVQVDTRFDSAAAREASRSAALTGGLLLTGRRPVAPYAAVIADVAGPPSAQSGRAGVVVGLAKDAGTSVTAAFEAGPDPVNGRVAIDVVISGHRHRIASAIADLSGTASYAFVVNENYVIALVGRTASWVPVAHVRITDVLDFDLRDPVVLAAMQYAYGVTGDGAVAQLTRVRAGYYGEAGLRDPHVVSAADGTPLIRDGWLYFTATSAGLAFFQAAHWGVWRMDLSAPSRIEQVAHIFFERHGDILGDHAGHLVLDGRGGYHVAVSGWGDFDFNGVHVQYAHTTEDVLSGVHVLPSRQLKLPTTVDSWDPSMVHIDDRWYVAFVESPFQTPTFDFHPALARSPIGGGLNNLVRVGADLTRHQTEGTITQRIGNKWYVLASDGDERRYRVYDLAMRLVGFIDAPYGTNIPHPMIVPIPQGARTSYLWITFEGTQFFESVLGYGTHGDLILLRSRQTVAGHEFS